MRLRARKPKAGFFLLLKYGGSAGEEGQWRQDEGGIHFPRRGAASRRHSARLAVRSFIPSQRASSTRALPVQAFTLSLYILTCASVIRAEVKRA